ncbi:hypothetical protein [Actinokineospora globicatena]|uniref:hypothetical protein n=1 Tax=Actinokineospora globicatena TaxID=103729 RepID=UPI0020A57F5D|nr:hypothetical protein [Actinokineospora globicatena]MCP2303164.1 hypothetical protein [Actinokineospora globicatena]GLW79719.1 hypothetical protein Aglo01_42000 [Actinokineospora globicatena]GLW85871.1 hypothetical protein Aglo02_35110 [Actinokineospora globicatena]
MTLLEEMTRVVLATPSPTATPAQIAAWYTSKADLLDRIAREEGTRSPEAHDMATTARAHARQLQAALR